MLATDSFRPQPFGLCGSSRPCYHPTMLQIQNVSFVLAVAPSSSADIEHSRGAKIGLVRRNGTNETTLLKQSRGHRPTMDQSKCHRTIIGTSHRSPAGQASLLDTVLAADTERESLLQSETATDPARCRYSRAVSGHGRSFSAGARRCCLSGLGFDEDAQHRPCMLGGWQRVHGSNSFMRPTLPDEPTNHLV